MNAHDSLASTAAERPMGKGRGLRRWLIYGGTAISVAVALAVAIKASSLALNDLDSRVNRLELLSSSVVTPESLSSLREALLAEIDAVKSGLSESRQQVAALQQQVTALSGQLGDAASLRQALTDLRQAQQAQENRLNGLTGQLSALETKPAAAPVTKSPEEGKNAGVVKKLATAKPRQATASLSAGRHAPFVLTGVEKRGSGSWAAIAPRGYSSLSQIALMGEGETVSGWTLVRVGHSDATFRVNGRLTALRAE